MSPEIIPNITEDYYPETGLSAVYIYMYMLGCEETKELT